MSDLMHNAAQKHPIINWFTRNSVAANLLMMGILLTGLYMVGFFGLSSTKLRLEAFPAIPINVVTVKATLNGSTPEDVEQGVTNKIEEALQGIAGVKKIESASSADIARVYVEGNDGYDMDKLLDDVKSKVDAINGLPAEVEKVLTNKMTFQQSIVWVTLYGEANEKTLKTEANRLKNTLLQNPFVETIAIDGERAGEIAIEVSERQLQAYNITLTQIANAVNNSSLDLSSGSIDTAQGSVTLRIKNQAHTSSDYENIIIRSSADGSSIRLGDIATVTDGFVEQQVISLFNEQPSLTLRLYSGEKANVIEADQAVTDIVEQFSPTLPGNVQVKVWNNRVSHVKDRIDLFVRNSTTGVILVFLLLTLFLNLRLAFWVALGIPVSFCGALILMQVFDISISLISLFGFILVLGIVVDDAIIIGESIFTQKKRDNNHPNATIKGAARVSTAATFGVLTTVAAFLPLTQIAGGMGNILGQIGMVVIFCLIFSLIESKLILPAHLYHTHVATRESRDNSKNLWVKCQSSVSHGLELLIEKTYLPVLTLALRQRYFALMVFLAMFILAIGTVMGGILKVAFMPRVESQDISVTVNMDNTAKVETTMALAEKVAKDLRRADELLMEQQGTSTPNVTDIAAFNTSDTQFMVRAGLASAQTRNLSAPEVVKQWREVVGRIPGAKSVSYAATRRFSDADIEVILISDDPIKQLKAAEVLMADLAAIKGIKDISSSLDSTANEIRLKVKPEAASYGITETLLAKTIRAAFYGIEAERVQRGREEVRVVVRYPKSERKSLVDLAELKIRTDSGRAIPLTAVAELSFASSPNTIEHLNGKNALTVFANVERSQNSADSVLFDLQNSIFPTLKANYNVDITLGGDNEEDEQSKSSMVLGFVASLVMIYLLLAIPLKSYFKPLIIMAVIPFGIIGAILGHLLLGMQLSIVGLFGVIALSGVVVNDSLLLLSSIQQHREEGLPLFEAIQRTGVRRFRPIILTSITTFVGLMPMLFETSFQAQFLIPMSVSLGFGILFATSITLVLVPVLYYIAYDIKRLFFYEVSATEKDS